MRTKVTDLHPSVEWYSLNEGYREVGIIELAKGTVVIERDLISFMQLEAITLFVNYNGKRHLEIHDRLYSHRFCTTLAKRFMKEVVQLSEGNNE